MAATSVPPVRSRAHERTSLLGMPIDVVTNAEVVDHVMDELDAGRGGWLVTPNLHHLREHTRRPELRPIFADADLVVADGAPLVWAARLQGTPLPERVAGSDLIWSLSAGAAAHGASVFLLGGDEGVAERAAVELVRANPGLDVAGIHRPPFGFEDDPVERERIDEVLLAARPDVVFVALGFPRQDHLIRRLRVLLPGAWFVGVGISFSFVAGEVVRAPRLLQRAGLEWIHRLVQEPRRLFTRYVVHGVPFAVRLLTLTSAAGLRRRVRARRVPSDRTLR
jgi:N-acetylglucosaminyldiphosphoundecaprenol N-acetyl-beta-D-mannosaminyltransferase